MQNSRIFIWMLLIGVIATSVPSHSLWMSFETSIDWSKKAPKEVEKKTEKGACKVLPSEKFTPLGISHKGLSYLFLNHFSYSDPISVPRTPPPEYNFS